MRSTNSDLDIARDQLKASGISIKQWADKHGFSEDNVYAFLSGKNKATRGVSHQIAVALGIKARPPIEDAPEFIKKMFDARNLTDAQSPTASAQELAMEEAVEFCHQRLRNERRKAGLTQSKLAALGGVSRATQVGYESGKNSPTISYLSKLQDIIDVRIVLFDDAGRIK